jgi:hypothetical protein
MPQGEYTRSEAGKGRRAGAAGQRTGGLRLPTTTG